MTKDGLSVTMADVAKAAGVSRALVSIVVRGVPGASEETRERVRRIAAELGYVPDQRAQALRAQAPRAIGVAFQAVQPFHAALVDGIYQTCEPLGYQVVLSAITSAHGEAAAISSLQSNRCGAIIDLSARLAPKTLAQVASRIPVIVVARAVRAEGVEYVCSDDERGLKQAVEHLSGLGHRAICFCSSADSGGGPERLRGYRTAMKAAGMAADVVETGSTEESGYETGLSLLARESLPTAVIGFNDNCAAGVQTALKEAGIKVPDEVSLLGIDDTGIAAAPYHQFTSVRQDVAWLGKTASLRAIARLEGTDGHRRAHIIPTTLTIRSSTAPPRR
ncbi:MAG: LacI family transcriptional regulator [Propionibacteriaceae bacterium]|nr:LacI family transcriptional regulator [Propionibacteriaceae bacterium]